MKLLMQGLFVAGGGAIGAVARWAIALGCGTLFGSRFPIGTLVINLSGSLFLGWFLSMANTRAMISDNMRLAVAVGFVGAYTTFSTFMYESHALWDDGAFIKAVGNIVGSIVLGLLAVRLGMYLAAR